MRHLSLLYLVLQFSLGSGRGFRRLVRGADMPARPARGRSRAPWPQACAVAADVRRASRQAVRGMIGRHAGGGASMAHPWMADRLRAGGAPISGPVYTGSYTQALYTGPYTGPQYGLMRPHMHGAPRPGRARQYRKRRARGRKARGGQHRVRGDMASLHPASLPPAPYTPPHYRDHVTYGIA